MERKSAWSLPMTEQEIVKEYKEAKSPRTQIGILADQNGCDKKTIANILEAAGCEVPGWYKSKKDKPEAAAEVFDEIAEETQKLQPEPVKEAPKEEPKTVKPETKALAVVYTKAAAYDAIVEQIPGAWDDNIVAEFLASVIGIRTLVKKLLKEA